MSDPIKSAARALRVFELFAEQQRPLTITELMEGLSIPQSSTSMLTKSLVHLGYLEQDETARTYFPTPRITFLGTWLLNQEQQVGVVPELLQKIAEQTGESAILAMRNGIFAQYLMVHVSADPLRLHVASGLLRPLCCCSTGWTLLAQEADKEIGKIIRRTQAESSNPYWRETASQAEQHVAFVRRNGFAYSVGETTRGAGALAMLLPAASGKSKFAVAIGGPNERIKAKKNMILTSLRALTEQTPAERVAAAVA